MHAFVSIGEDVEVGDGSTLHPGAVIGDRCKLGKGVIIHPNAVLYADVILGDRVEVHAGTVVGGDGFKYHMVEGKHVKVPHTGRVEVGADVEIGSNCTIDRATFETTRIGEGTKVDNLVMIGHNNQIGRHNLLCGQVGIAGSCKTGDYVVMAGQAGIKDHTEIGDKVMVGAQAGRPPQHPDRPERARLAGHPDPRAAAALPDDRPPARDAQAAPRADRDGAVDDSALDAKRRRGGRPDRLLEPRGWPRDRLDGEDSHALESPGRPQIRRPRGRPSDLRDARPARFGRADLGHDGQAPPGQADQAAADGSSRHTIKKIKDPYPQKSPSLTQRFKQRFSAQATAATRSPTPTRASSRRRISDQAGERFDLAEIGPMSLALDQTTHAPPGRLAEAPIGLLAGSGRFPILFAEAAKRQGLKVACVGIRYEAPEVLSDLCDSFEVVGVSKLGGMIRSFRRRGVGRIVMAGKVTKSVMYTPGRFVRLMPDLRMIRFWLHGTLADKRDDSILLGVIAEFERDGMSFASALDYCPELLVTQGVLTRRRPGVAEMKDVEFGWMLAKEMGRLDVGQSVAVKESAAVAVEAIEGTDRCIERAGQLCRAGGLDPRQGRQAPARHAVRRAHHRRDHDREPAQGRGQGPGDRGRQDDRHRPARRRRIGGSVWIVDRRPRTLSPSRACPAWQSRGNRHPSTDRDPSPRSRRPDRVVPMSV